MKFALLTALGMSLSLLTQESAAQNSNANCNLQDYQFSSGIEVNNSATGPLLTWSGAGSEQLQMQLTIVDGEPFIKQLEMRAGNAGWHTVLTDVRIEFDIVEGFRRISNQQLVPLRELGVELTQEVVDLYKWDVFWDAPQQHPLQCRQLRGSVRWCAR